MTAVWPVILGGAALVGAAAGCAGRAAENVRADRWRNALIAAASDGTGERVRFDDLSALPAPVARYFRTVLSDGQGLVRSARLGQAGVLRTRPDTAVWRSFSASQFIVPPAPGFVWDARVGMPLATHVRVLDGYVGGKGSGRVSLQSALPVAADAGASELDAGALHRYLAEAVWCPTALLPAAGVQWQPIDDHSALASLTDGATSVALTFRFGAHGEVTGVYSPGRYGRFDGGYRRVPWEGRFRGLRAHAGMRIPEYGEVGWYLDGGLRLVWRGRITAAEYRLA